MRRRLVVILSIVFIFAIGWADIKLDSREYHKYFSAVIQQLLYFLSLLVVMGIGYLNWKGSKYKWLMQLWLLIYTAVIFFICTGIAVFLLGGNATNQYVRFVIKLRNYFISPLPFFTFYMLSLLVANIKRQQPSAKQ